MYVKIRRHQHMRVHAHTDISINPFNTGRLAWSMRAPTAFGLWPDTYTPTTSQLSTHFIPRCSEIDVRTVFELTRFRYRHPLVTYITATLLSIGVGPDEWSSLRPFYLRAVLNRAHEAHMRPF